MKETEGGAGKFPPCGYGVLGLCCSACLLGPCRLTPFGEGPERGLCGDDRDRIVARNLLRLARHEATCAMKDLRDALLRKRPSSPSSPLVEESKSLLSLIPEKRNPHLSSLYPERLFPSIHRIFPEEDFPPKSLTGILLDSIDVGQNGPSGVEEILDRCLQISLLSLMSEELCHHLNRPIPGEGGEGEEGSSEENQKLSDFLDRLPSIPCPVIVQLSEGDTPFPAAEQRLKKLDGAAPIFSIREGHGLPEIGRRLLKKWDLPATGLRAVVLISSSRVTPTLGALALGFTVASFPPLLIHGSDRVETFFLSNFRKRFGNAYLPSWQEDLDSMIMDCLKGTG